MSYLQLFDAKTPGNVQTFLGFFEEVTAFEVLPAEEWTNDIFYVAETSAPSVNF